ncbi:MAG: DEAD/DEAH box helicase [Methanomassiliicoccales archaeon]|nr:DEAD/DEAH box helicase [Methanomassiliicoccales archaeon]
MRVKDLDLPEGVADILIADGIEELYPPQEEAVPLALEGKNLFLAIPTASGKSLVAYLAALKQVLEKGGKALYIVPLRALAAEKYEDLMQFSKLGVRVGVSVGDFDSPEPELEHYDIIVATSEKADSLLRHRTSWLEKISLVVADEVHLIHDPERGPTLEITLTKFRRFNPRLQTIALSATVKNSKELAEWMRAEHVTSEWRPTPLKEGVYLKGEIRFTDNTTRTLEDMGDAVWSLIRDSVLEGGQCLVFVNTRKSTEALAMKFAPMMHDLIPGHIAVEGEENLVEDQGEPTSIGRKLRACVKKGVAFHNAGLANEQRRMVERAFKSGKIKAIIATPTLAAGINLPARRVVVRDVSRYEGGVGNVAIPVLEIKQMCGRAGRPRYDKFGEAVLVAKDEEESEFLFENYLLNETEEIFSKLGSENVLRMHVLALVATGVSSSKRSLMEFMDSTFLAHQTNLVGLSEAVDTVLDFLRNEGMVEGEERLRATFFGRRVSDLYIDPQSAVKLRDALRAYSGQGEFGFLHAVCSTPDVLALYLRRSDYGWLEKKVVELEKDLLLPMPTDLSQYDFFLGEVKTAMVLQDWLQETEEEPLLEKYGIGPGDLRNKVEMGEWLLYSMRELSNIFNKDAYPVLTEMMTRIKYGVKTELLDLVRLRGVGRARARSLSHHGLKTLDDIRAIDESKLARIPKIGEAVARSIKEQLGQMPQRLKKEEVKKIEPPREELSGNQRSLSDF